MTTSGIMLLYIFSISVILPDGDTTLESMEIKNLFTSLGLSQITN